jgi:hypothetical protein
LIGGAPAFVLIDHLMGGAEGAMGGAFADFRIPELLDRAVAAPADGAFGDLFSRPGGASGNEDEGQQAQNHSTYFHAATSLGLRGVPYPTQRQISTGLSGPPLSLYFPQLERQSEKRFTGRMAWNQRG